MSFSMTRRRNDSEGPGLQQRLIWGTLNALSGHSKPISRKPMSSYRKFTPSRPVVRKVSNYQPPPLTPSLGRRKNCLTPPRATSPGPSSQEREREITQKGEEENEQAKNKTEEEEKEDEAKIIFEQKQSLLFQKLPEEILIQIYEFVLGRRTIHIVRRYRSLSHAVCKSESENIDECRGLKCRGMKLPNGVCLSEDRGGKRDTFVALLQSCRKIYMAAIPILYTSNTFLFDSIESLLSLSTSLLPHRFDAICTITLDFRFDQSHFFCEGTPSTDYVRWERTWRIIGSMKNLQCVRCRIVWWKADITGAEEKRYLGELLQVGGLRRFEVSLPSLKWGDEKEMDAEATWVVVRRGPRR